MLMACDLHVTCWKCHVTMQPLTSLKQVSDWLSHVPLFLQRCECTGKSRSHPAWFEGLGEAGQEGVLPGIEEEGTG